MNYKKNKSNKNMLFKKNLKKNHFSFSPSFSFSIMTGSIVTGMFFLFSSPVFAQSYIPANNQIQNQKQGSISSSSSEVSKSNPLINSDVGSEMPSSNSNSPSSNVPLSSDKSNLNPYANTSNSGISLSSAETSNQPQSSPQSLPPIPSNFELGVKKTLGLTPDEIRTLHRLLNERQKATYEMPNPPKMVTSSIDVSLSPGSSPSLIRPFFGVSTSLVILDSTGEPWPVENFSVGNGDLFSVERMDGKDGSSFVISPKRTYGQTNLILKLKGKATPVVINLVSGQKVADVRVAAHVMALGPNARTTVSHLAGGVDSRLLSVLDGVPPNGRSVKVLGDRGSSAWMMPNNHLWLRTKLNVISPAPLSFVSAADGTHVYELMPTAKVLGMDNGQFVTLSLDGCLQECSGNSSDHLDHW